MLTTANTFVHSHEVKALSTMPVAAVKAEILRHARRLYGARGHSFELSHERGSVFSLVAFYDRPVGDVTGHYVAEMPLRRMLVVLRWKARS